MAAPTGAVPIPSAMGPPSTAMAPPPPMGQPPLPPHMMPPPPAIPQPGQPPMVMGGQPQYSHGIAGSHPSQPAAGHSPYDPNTGSPLHGMPPGSGGTMSMPGGIGMMGQQQQQQPYSPQHPGQHIPVTSVVDFLIMLKLNLFCFNS